jgi:hypothetical protein
LSQGKLFIYFSLLDLMPNYALTTACAALSFVAPASREEFTHPFSTQAGLRPLRCRWDDCVQFSSYSIYPPSFYGDAYLVLSFLTFFLSSL